MANNPTPGQTLFQAAGMSGTLDNAPVADATSVYMGPGFRIPVNPSAYGSLTASQVPKAGVQYMADTDSMRPTVWGMEKAKAYFAAMDPAVRATVQEYANNLYGYEQKNQTTVRAEWERALEGSAYLSRMSGQPVTVFDYMKMQVAANPYGASSGSGGGGGGGYNGPSTTTQINLASQSDAEALVDQALTTYLGREADDGERDRFWKLLGRAQRNNPTVTTTTPNGHDATVVTQNGVNVQQAAKDFALSQKDSAEYMANTEYMDWLMAKVSSDPTEVIASGL